jgi:hypothetical protein
MNENFESTVESSRKTVSDFGTQAKERLLTQVRTEPAKTLSIVLGGAVVLSVLLGYCLSRMEKTSKRERLVEDWMREATDWINQNGRKIAAPIKEGLEATKSAVEGAAQSSARAGRQMQPFFEKQKRSFLNLFWNMDLSQQDVSSVPEQGLRAAKFQYREELEDRLNGLRTDAAARPFLYLAIAFVAGFVSNTFPARMLFLILMRVLSWLMGPVILVLGVIKLSKLVATGGTFQVAPAHSSTQPVNGQSTNFPWMNFRTCTVFILGVLLLVGCNNGNPVSKLNRANYDQIREKASKEEVQAILGPPTSTSTEDKLIYKRTTWRYTEGNKYINITFKNDELDSKDTNLGTG